MTAPNPFDGHDTLWVLHISKDETTAIRARDEGFVCIGWSKLGDLNQYPTRDALKEAMLKTWPDWKPKKVYSCYGQVFRFAHEMKVGDPVVLPIKQTREIAIGRIADEYRYAPEGSDFRKLDYANLRDVEWLAVVERTVFSQAALHSFGSFSSVSTSDDHLDEVLSVLQGDHHSEGESDQEEPTGQPAEPDADEDAPNLYETALQETEDYLLKAWQRTGAHFEHVVAAVFEAMGYTAKVTQASGDHGVDVIAHPDPLGLETPYIKVQAKSGTSTIGERETNQLKGCLNAGEKGILISLGKFASGAENVARSTPDLQLIGAKEFVSLFLEHYDRLEPTWQAKYPLKRAFVPVR